MPALLSTVSCWTCKRRKIGCDKAIPACKNCSRTNRTCEAYGLKLSWPDKADGRRKPFRPAIAQSHDHLALNSSLQSKFSPIYLINTDIDDVQLSGCYIRPPTLKHIPLKPILPTVNVGLSTTKLTTGEAKLLSYYEAKLARFITTLDDAENGFRHQLLPMALSHHSHAAQSLKAAILALCAFHLGYHEDALQYKARSLHSLELSLRVERSDSMSAQVAACMMLCVYGVFDMSDGNWVVHLRGAKGIVEKYHQCAELSSFLRSWLLYHEVLSQFSLKIRGDENLHPVPEPMEDNTVIIGSLGCSEELMELIACINSIPNACPDEDYIQTVGLRLESISQIIVIKEEDHNLVYPSSIDIHRIQVTAEFYHVAALLYFHHHVQRLASKHPTIKALVRSALNLISQMGVCTSPWPLFVVACEVTEDAERLQILDTFAGMEQHRRIGNISATRMIVETLWKQHDLADDDLARPNIEWRSIVDMKTISPSFI